MNGYLVFGGFALVLSAISMGIGSYTHKMDFMERAKHVSERSTHHEIAVGSYLECRNRPFSSNEDCVSSSIHRAKQDSLSDSSTLYADMRELTKDADISVFEQIELGFWAVLRR